MLHSARAAGTSRSIHCLHALTSLIPVRVLVPAMQLMPAEGEYVGILVKHISQTRSSCRATSMHCIHVCREMDSLVERLSQPEPGSAPLRFATPYPQSTLQQYFILLRKNTVCYWRYPQYNNVRLNVVVLFGLLLGAVFWGVGRNRCVSLSLHPFFVAISIP